jgi:hypothetical protein
MRRRSRITSFVIAAAFVCIASACASSLGEPSALTKSGTFWETIRASAQWIAEVVRPILATIAGVGAATMAAQQAFKDLFNLRRNYNRRIVAEWIVRRLGTLGDSKAALSQLEELATSGEADALYSLEAGKLATQIAAAGRMALDRSDRYGDLLRCLLRDASSDDYRIATNRTSPPGVAEVEAKTRLMSYLQRTTEGFQILLNYRWTHANQVVALVLNTAVFLFLWLFWSRSPAYFFTALAAALLGAFIAPVAKDLVTALQSIKDLKR